MKIPTHTDINTGEGLVLADFPALTITEAVCKEIIATTLETVLKHHAYLTGKSVSLSLYLIQSNCWLLANQTNQRKNQ